MPPQKNVPNLHLITKIARHYHEEGLTQAEIAKMLAISQVSVSRMLKRAEELRIVSTTVISPPGIFMDLEYLVQTKFGLKQAIIAEATSDTEESIMNAIGSSAAYYLDTILRSDTIIGVSAWSSSLLAMVDHLRPIQKVQNCTIVQLQGGVGNPSAEKHAHHLAARLARLVHGDVRFLSAPGIVASAQTMQILKKDPSVIQTTQLYKKVSLALLGIGTTQQSSLLASSGNAYAEEDMQQLQQLGAVGDIVSRFFDINGQIINTDLNDRVLSIDLAELRNINYAVGIAGGDRKVNAIIGAMRGGYINVLITDQFTAEKLLRTV